ncbi:MAG: TIGR03032 family protein [Thermoguttaceae bacterium]|jgi:uncharacterized protein (TIGR03032 family)
MNNPLEIQCLASAAFEEWLARAGGSVAVSTYQAGKVAMIGWDGRQVTLLMRDFDKPLGLAAAGNRMVLATRHDLCIFANTPLLAYEFLENQPGRYDALYLPRATYHTGDLHTHDVAISAEGIIITATRFSCLARLSFDFNFVPFWKPSFVSDLVPEDRCHLNGLALYENRPKYVTALGKTDKVGGWRENKAAGGVIIDVTTDEIVTDGLSMPHSPRWYDGRLWVLNSGTGELATIDVGSGRQNVVCGLPGYLRGLCFIGPYAVVGLSRIREKHIFGGLPVQTRWERLRCGLAVVDLRSGQEAGFFEFTEGCEEIYDVQFLPGLKRPMILNLEKPATRQAISNPDSAFWLRPGNEIRDDAAATQNNNNNIDQQNYAKPPVEGAAGPVTATATNQVPDAGNLS